MRSHRSQSRSRYWSFWFSLSWGPCMACGSDTTPTYLDGSNAMKAGFCVCSALDPATPGKWSCASVEEGPPACLTDR